VHVWASEEKMDNIVLHDAISGRSDGLAKITGRGTFLSDRNVSLSCSLLDRIL
jgi:hypothetical protein